MKFTVEVMIKKLVAICVLLFIISACVQYPDKPPPKYKILHNTRGGYIIEMPSGHKIYKWNHKNELYSSQKEALKRAWEQYNYIPCEKDTTIWIEYNTQQDYSYK